MSLSKESARFVCICWLFFRTTLFSSKIILTDFDLGLAELIKVDSTSDLYEIFSVHFSLVLKLYIFWHSVCKWRAEFYFCSYTSSFPRQFQDSLCFFRFLKLPVLLSLIFGMVIFRLLLFFCRDIDTFSLLFCAFLSRYHFSLFDDDNPAGGLPSICKIWKDCKFVSSSNDCSVVLNRIIPFGV